MFPRRCWANTGAMWAKAFVTSRFGSSEICSNKFASLVAVGAFCTASSWHIKAMTSANATVSSAKYSADSPVLSSFMVLPFVDGFVEISIVNRSGKATQ